MNILKKNQQTHRRLEKNICDNVGVFVERIRQEAESTRSNVPDMYIGPHLNVVGDVLFIRYAHIDGYLSGKLTQYQWMGSNEVADFSFIQIGRDGEVV